MEEAQSILLEALEMAGIVMPPGIAAVSDIGPAALISMCSQALGIIGGHRGEVYMPGSVPQSVSVRFRVCMELAERVTQLGYRDDLNFHQFLYPNEADVHRLLRFLLDRISRSAPGSAGGRTSRRRRNATPRRGDGASTSIDALVRHALSGWPGASDRDEEPPPPPYHLTPDSDLEKEAEGSIGSENAANNEEDAECDNQARIITGGNFLDMPPDKEKRYMEILSELNETQAKIATLERENSNVDASDAKEARFAEDDPLLRRAVEVIESCSSSPKLALEKLETEIEQARESLKKRNFARESLSSQPATTSDQKLLKEIEDICANLNARKREHAALTSRLENFPKQALRSNYVRRITELVKNSKKQDTDIAKIISETRILQRDYNATQERLGRVHILVDELIFRDAKREAQCRSIYRHLSSMHESFSGLVDKVLEMDKLERDIADIQGKLEGHERETVDVDKVKADLHAILAENNVLETKTKVTQTQQ